MKCFKLVALVISYKISALQENLSYIALAGCAHAHVSMDQDCVATKFVLFCISWLCPRPCPMGPGMLCNVATDYVDLLFRGCPATY